MSRFKPGDRVRLSLQGFRVLRDTKTFYSAELYQLVRGLEVADVSQRNNAVVLLPLGPGKPTVVWEGYLEEDKP